MVALGLHFAGLKEVHGSGEEFGGGDLGGSIVGFLLVPLLFGEEVEVDAIPFVLDVEEGAEFEVVGEDGLAGFPGAGAGFDEPAIEVLG